MDALRSLSEFLRHHQYITITDAFVKVDGVLNTAWGILVDLILCLVEALTR